MKSQKKWNQKNSEHNQCQCQIMSESSYCHNKIIWELKKEKKKKKNSQKEWNLKKKNEILKK